MHKKREGGDGKKGGERKRVKEAHFHDSKNWRKETFRLSDPYIPNR